jgi:hypothetical protein
MVRDGLRIEQCVRAMGENPPSPAKVDWPIWTRRGQLTPKGNYKCERYISRGDTLPRSLQACRAYIMNSNQRGWCNVITFAGNWAWLGVPKTQINFYISNPTSLFKILQSETQLVQVLSLRMRLSNFSSSL